MGPSAGAPGRPLGEIEPVVVELPITLGQFIKAAGFAGTGGDAKRLVSGSAVIVNGKVETRRGHKLAPGDIVTVGGRTARVVARPGPGAGHPRPGD